MKHTLRWFSLVLVLTLVLSACGGRETPPPPTNTPMPTNTAAPTEPPPPTHTPEPTPTPEPTDAPEPTAAPMAPDATPVPELGLDSGWYPYTNGNFVRDIAVTGDVIVAATGGGVIVWVLDDDEILSYTTLDGLPTNDIQTVAICPLPDPQIIVGTEYGLSTYDEENDVWELMTSDNSGMNKEGVDTLDCDPDRNTLFVGYTFGLDIYDGNSDTWTYYDEDDGLITDWVDQAAYVGEDLWIVSSFGFSVVRSDGSVEGFDEDTGTTPEENVAGVVGDANGNVWLAAFDGLMKYSNGEFTIYNSDNADNFPFLDAFERVLVDAEGMIWVGNTFGSICKFDPAQETCLEIYEDEDGMVGGLNAMVWDEVGNLYFADEGEGISKFDGAAWQKFELDELPLRNSYNAITQTPDGTVWLGGSFGLQILDAFDPSAEWTHNDMEGYTVNSFFHTAEGWWIAHGAGASFYNYADAEWTNYEYAEEAGQGIYDGGATVIAEDGQGRVWFGTYNGLTVMDGDTFAYYDLLTKEEREEERSARTVKSLLFDGEYMWVGAYGALFRFDENDDYVMWDEDLPGILSLFTPSANALALDADGKVLLAIGSRLMRYDAEDEQFREVYEAESEIYSILITNAGNIWLGTYSSGVAAFENGEWLTLSTADGLPSNHFQGKQSILLDSSGTVWFAASDGGLSRFIP